MKIQVLSDAEAVAREAAKFIEVAAREAVVARGKFTVAFSGGRSPAAMLRLLTGDPGRWHVFQVDERVAPAGHSDRNLTQLVLPAQIYPMPVEEPDLEVAARRYEVLLPPVFDLVHLGLGVDGHTASLVPGEELTGDVAVTGVYQGRRRLTLTLPALNRARRVLWVVTGADKAAMLARLLAADASIPAGRVRQDRAVVLADCAAAPLAVG
jgi:6-phosphogluconolactonase/glucosamine-6-phosphate isomerase/deaminase